jgi:hypothetical protein
MTTRDFIARQFGNNDGKTRRCSSVVKDGQGDIYSYGTHYPLLFTLKGRTFINTAGYSFTTAKHINWAKQACEYQAIEVKLPHTFRLDGREDYNFKQVQDCLIEQATELTMELARKKRKDTQVFRNLENELIEVSTSLEAIR